MRKYLDVVERATLKKIKSKKGITLVALVITIVILLILAGISILALIHSGLIKKGSKAKEEYENSQYKENMILSEYEEKISGTRSDNINTLSNINIYVDDIKKETIPEKDSNYIYTYYTSTNDESTIEFDKEKWSINIYNVTDVKTQFNIYFYEKDKINVVLKLLNINEKYNSIQELYNNKLWDILSNTIVYEYIIYSNGNLAQELIEYIDGEEFSKKTVEAYADGTNIHSITLDPGKYIIKLSGNTSFEVKEFWADENKIEPLRDNIYVYTIKNSIKINWYCNHPNVHKYLYIEYKSL